VASHIPFVSEDRRSSKTGPGRRDQVVVPWSSCFSVKPSCSMAWPRRSLPDNTHAILGGRPNSIAWTCLILPSSPHCLRGWDVLERRKLGISEPPRACISKRKWSESGRVSPKFTERLRYEDEDESVFLFILAKGQRDGFDMPTLKLILNKILHKSRKLRRIAHAE
jgi:hypothetical protein